MNLKQYADIHQILSYSLHATKLIVNFNPVLLLMSKLLSKVSPSFPAPTDTLPNHKYEGVEVVLQEAKKDEAVSTLHNTQTNHIKSIHMYIFASIKIEK